MTPIRTLIIGFPTGEIRGNPLDTLFGIRVRDWALFTLLPKYGFETYYLVEAQTDIADDIAARYGDRLVQGSTQAKKMAERHAFDVIICSGTKFHELWRQRSGKMMQDKGVPIFGAFCYDNESSPIDPEFQAQMIGASFTSHDHKTIWDNRCIPVASLVTTTGQNAPTLPIASTDGSVVFVGFIHDERYLAKIAKMAVLLPDRQFNVISSFVRDHNQQGKTFHKMALLNDTERQALIRRLVEKHTDKMPSNFNYLFRPPGEDAEVLQHAAVGLDFSWSPNQSIENSKICRYLTHGIFPVSQLPATSYRFVERFDYGAIVPYSASTEEWVVAIEQVAQVSTMEERQRVGSTAQAFFSWENVAFDVAGHIISKLRPRTKPIV